MWSKPYSKTTFCSAIKHKLKRGHHSNLCDQNHLDRSLNMESSSDSQSRKLVGNDMDLKKKYIESIAKKIRKNMSVILFAIKSNEAYQPSVDGCETCVMGKDAYRKIMHSIKIIEILVDSVVEEEQRNLLKEELGSEDGFGEGIKGDLRKYHSYEKKQNVQVSNKDTNEHNLKCILIKLQKSIVDAIVQVCYVKRMNKCGRKENETFNISISGLKLLKYECINLKYPIILLFKKPSKITSKEDNICVDCVKEKLSECTERLVNVLRSGRNLKVVLKNNTAKEVDSCCSRTYLHIHAESEGSPVVAKYVLPFQVNHANKTDIKVEVEDTASAQTMKSSDNKTTGNKPKYKQELLGPPRKDVPHYKCLEGMPVGTKNKEVGHMRVEDTPYMTDEIPDKIKKRKDKLQNEHLDSEPYLPSEPYDDHSIRQKPIKSFPSTAQSSKVPKNDRIKSSSSSNQSIQKPTNAPVKSSSNRSNQTHTNSSIGIENEELFCGCNWENVYEKLLTKKQESPDISAYDCKDSPEHVNTSRSNISKDIKSEQSLKHVAFADFDLKTQVLLPVDFMKSNNVFNLTQETYCDADGMREDGKHTNTFDETTENTPVHLEAMDSLILTKQRISTCENISTEVNDQFYDKGIVAAFKPFIHETEYNVNVTYPDQPNVQDVFSECGKDNTEKKKGIRDILKDMNTNTVRAIYSVPDCYNDYSLQDYGSTSNLPFSSSLKSLPLDENDLKAIAAALGENIISHENILLLPEDDTTDRMCVWETQYGEETVEENNTKWIRAFPVSDNPLNNLFTSFPETKQESSRVRKSNEKRKRSLEDVHILPTIAEEIELVYEDKHYDMPYVPSISSLPLTEAEIKKLSEKTQAFTKHKTTELRYFTVEFPQTSQVHTINFSNNTTKALCSSFTGTMGPQNSGFKNLTDVSLKQSKLLSGNCSKVSGCSFKRQFKDSKSLNVTKKASTPKNKGLNLKALDEMIMLNAMFLCCDIFEKNKPNEILKKPLKNMFTCTTNSFFENGSNGQSPNFNSNLPLEDYCKISHVISKSESNKVGFLSSNESELPVSNCFTANKNMHSITKIPFNSNAQSLRNKKIDLKHLYDKENILSLKNDNTILSSTIIKDSIVNCADQISLYNDACNNLSSKNQQSKIISNLDVLNFTEERKDTLSKLALPIKLNIPSRVNKSHKVLERINSLKLKHIPIQEINKKNHNISMDCIQEPELRISSDTDDQYKSYAFPSFLLRNEENFNGFSNDITDKNVHFVNDSPKRTRRLGTNIKNENNPSINLTQDTSFNSENSSNIDFFRNLEVIGQQYKPECDGQNIKTSPKMYTPNLGEITKYNTEPLVPSSIRKSDNLKLVNVDSTANSRGIDAKFIDDIVSKIDNPSKSKTEFGIEKAYISVKTCNPAKRVKHCETPFEPIPNTNILSNMEFKSNQMKDKKSVTKNVENSVYLTKSADNDKQEMCPIEEAFYIDECASAQSTMPSSLFNKKYSYPSGHSRKTWFLYDGSGRPLTDSSGRLLRNNKGELLVVCDETGIPICDENYKPIHDRFGRRPDNKHFNPTKPFTTDFYKSLTTPTGEPMAVYDMNGRPLTSVSGTMLFHCTGRGLIRFGSNGNPVGDLEGNPIFDINGRQITYL